MQYAASTIRNLSSAIRWLCWENRHRQGISCDLKNAGDYELFRQANKWAQRVIKGQGPRWVVACTPVVPVPVPCLTRFCHLAACRRQGDPQASTAADTYTAEEYARISELLVQGQAAASQLNMTTLMLAQTQALFHIMHFGAGRGDDARVMMLADISKPRPVEVLSGAADCVMVPIVLYGTKTQRVSSGMGSSQQRLSREGTKESHMRSKLLVHVRADGGLRLTPISAPLAPRAVYPTQLHRSRADEEPAEVPGAGAGGAAVRALHLVRRRVSRPVEGERMVRQGRNPAWVARLQLLELMFAVLPVG